MMGVRFHILKKLLPKKKDFPIRNHEDKQGNIKKNESDQFNFIYPAFWPLFLLFSSLETFFSFSASMQSSSLSRITSSRKASLTIFPCLELLKNIRQRKGGGSEGERERERELSYYQFQNDVRSRTLLLCGSVTQPCVFVFIIYSQGDHMSC